MDWEPENLSSDPISPLLPDLGKVLHVSDSPSPTSARILATVSLLLPHLDQGPFAPSALISERNVRGVQSLLFESPSLISIPTTGDSTCQRPS